MRSGRSFRASRCRSWAAVERDRTARRIADEGESVVITGGSEERANELVHDFTGGGAKAHFAGLDIIDQEQWTAAFDDAQKTFGTPRVLRSIVGSNALVEFPDINPDEWNKIVEINIIGTLRSIQTFQLGGARGTFRRASMPGSAGRRRTKPLVTRNGSFRLALVLQSSVQAVGTYLREPVDDVQAANPSGLRALPI
ncbi:SDR family NAD(P)-dependent oxidoreductase [Streptomyces sp. NPDC002742]|uniref:SDR family NAD(P)-dependent oxidoreductase n=1 Tax=Streptomyces sp. NPDC002742 TaxID=3364663 RepID=UPI003685F087